MNKEQEIKIINDAALSPKLELYGTYEGSIISDILGIEKEKSIALVNYGMATVEVTIVPYSSPVIYYYYTFTDRWRQLRKIGSYEGLIKYEIERNKKQDEKIDLENRLLKSQNDFQEINNAYIAKQEQLITNQITTNISSIKADTNAINTNKIMRASVIITAILTGVIAFGTIYPIFIDHKISNMQLSLKGKDTLISQQNRQNLRLNQFCDSLKSAIVFLKAKP